MGNRGHNGFTMVELLTVLAIIGVSAAAAVSLARGRLEQGHFANTVVQAEAVARVADNYQSRVLSSAPVGAGTVQRTYTYAADFASWEPSATLAAVTGVPLAAETRYGTDIEFRAAGFVAEARFVVPVDQAARITIGGNNLRTAVDGSGNVTVVVQVERLASGYQTLRARGHRAVLMTEETR
ncbi:type II secretion system protein [Flagellatimonas centrodinii]|uniref:type II secretion system protein n=1 Tax=Flagellatimonas centrodinii TaxID=2806210 RepID=UPI00344EF526